VEKEQIDFQTICVEIKETLSPVAENKKIDLQWELPAGNMMIMGDSSRLVQVLTNLISNAFKHTPEKGRITVRATRQDGRILMEVMDTGRGIALEDQTKIFEQFYQVESSPTRRDGLGLGLSITKEIIAAHQGEIGVSSEGLGKGSRFWFTIPLLPS
jgi:signal transduction histidine kinase